MAVFDMIETPLFTCRNKECNSVLFEEVEIKSYITNNKKVSKNTSTKALKCIKCGEYHDISEEYDIIEQA